ncbi:MAG TPA: FG-GAP-like repeat-containing protein [Bryobacteraceae bacterium]
MADFNGDGNADLVISGYPGMRVYLGDGRGGFQSSWSYDSGTYLSIYLAVCDFNNDGKLDLAFATSGGAAALLPGNGDGTFQVPKSVPDQSGNNFSSSVAVGDFNGDGKADLVLANGSSVSIFTGRVGRTSFTTFTSSPDPSLYSQNVQLRATVSPPAATGTVTFFDGTTALGTSPLTDNQAELTIHQLSPGPHSLSAVYNGDALYFSSTSPVLVQTVNRSPITISLSSSSNPALAGQTVTLIASVTQPDATGTIEFREGPRSLGTRSIEGQTAFVASSFAAGSHLITATYNGDANYEAGTSQILTQVIATPAGTAITLSSSAARLTLGQSVTFTASVSPAAAGIVTFYDGAAVLGSTAVDRGQASLTTSLLPAGLRSIRVYYSGSVAYGPSSSPEIAVTVIAQPVNRFQPPATVLSGPATGVPLSFVIGDFNKDGKLDLAAVTATGVAVMLGNGDGSFQTAVNFATDTFPHEITTGDFNGDGKADLAVTASSGAVSVLLGNGDGTFQSFVTYNTGPNPGAIVAADVNGDGLVDLAVNTGYVLLGKGDGSFQNAVQWLNGGYLAVGDFNGDGKIDFIDASGVVQLGHGDGTFDPGARVNIVPAAHIQVFTSIADIDGDGNADVIAMVHAADMGGHGVLPNFTDTLSVYLGHGDGTFRPPVTVATGALGQFPGAIALGDFTSDGKMDVALLYRGTVSVFPGNGDGSFGAELPFTTDEPQSSLNITKVLLGDFNGDGRTDVAFAASGVMLQLGQLLPASTTNLLSSPNPSMYGQGVTLTATVGRSTASGVVTFFDGPSLTPLGTKTLQNGQASIDPGLLTLGTHSFTALYRGDVNFPASFSTAIPHNVITATPSVTLTSSANPALSGQNVFLAATVSNVAATGTIEFKDGSVTLATRILSNGKALLAISALPAGSHSFTATYSGDANNAASMSAALLQTIIPGNSSAVVLTSSVNPASYGRNVTLVATVSPPNSTGTVTFYDGVAMLGSRTLSAGQATLTTTLLESGTRQIRAFYGGDATHAPASTTLRQIVRAEPANGFAEIAQAVTTGYGSIVTGDFNGDSKPDLIITGTTLNLLLGNGDGTFQPPVDVGVGNARDSSVTTGDFNGDGKTDLVFSYRTGSGVSVLLGKGDGTFERPVSYPSFGWPTAVVTGDFNGDGNADIAIFSYTNSYSLRILLGNGDGSFQPLITSNLDFYPRMVVVADFNGDGKADLAIPTVNTQMVAILIGNGDGTFQTPINYDVGSSAIGVVLGDFNGDGRSDLGVATDDGTVAILLGNGDGTFRTAGSYRAGAQHYLYSMAVADFNGDAHADLAVSTSLGISVLAGNGDGTFQKPIYVGYGSGSVVVADFNGDGKSDFAIGSLSVFLGAMTSVPSLALAGTLNAAAVGDTTHYYRNGAQVSPGGLATIFGNFLQPADVSVQVGGGLTGPVLAASPGQVTFQVPWELAGQSETTVAVAVNGQTTAAQSMKLEPLTPGIFAVNDAGFGQGAIYDLSNRLVDSSNPATADTVVQIYCTGLGQVSNQPATGASRADQLSLTTNVPAVTIGNLNLQVLFSGLAPGLIGVYQVNVALPPAIPAYWKGPAIPVSISIGNISSNTVTMAVH